MIEIEESDNCSAIVAPDLRLRFRRMEDRWTHAIDLRPGPWLTLADAVEWTSAADDPARVVSPTYQELHLQRDGTDVVALLVGKAGPHYFSASVRATHRVYDSERSRGFGLEYSESRVEFDVADRCRAEVVSLECNYLVHEPPVILHLGDSNDSEAPEGFVRDWRSSLVWEARIEANYEVAIEGSEHPDPPTWVALSSWKRGVGYRVRVAPHLLTKEGTNRLRYSWSHTRVYKRS